MPLLIIAIIAVAVLLLVRGGAFSSSSKKCRWVSTGNDTVSLGEYYCKTCKVTAYARGRKPPQECKRNLRGGL